MWGNRSQKSEVRSQIKSWLRTHRLAVVAALAILLPPAVIAASFINYNVAVCDPANPGNCLAPNAGGLPLTGTVSNASSAQATSSANLGVVSWNYGFNGTTWDQLQVDASKFLKVNCAVGCSGGSVSNATSGVATSATNNGAVAWLYGFNGTTWDQLRDVSNASSGVATSAFNLDEVSYSYVFNGTTWDQQKSDPGATGAITIVPTATANATNAFTPGVAGSSSSSVVLKASAGNFYGAYAVDTGGAAKWLMIFNATSLPGNGATTAGTASGNLQDCIPIQANQQGSISYVPGPPEAFTVGITAALSSTSCGTLTASATGFIHGVVK